MGAFAYADDLALLAPTRQAMHKMISVCQKFSKDFDITFNPSKSSAIYFGDNNHDLKFHMNGKPIDASMREKHLGHIIGHKHSDTMINNAVNDLFARTNMLLIQFLTCSLDIKYKLFKSYYMCVYESSLWDFDNNACAKFYVACRRCI